VGSPCLGLEKAAVYAMASSETGGYRRESAVKDNRHMVSLPPSAKHGEGTERASFGGETARRILRRDPNPHLFRPIRLRGVESRNRIMLSPMCQYSAEDGLSNEWHFVHLGSRAVGGAGLIFYEAVHLEPAGRITTPRLGRLI